jgi:predicted PurR-regulated permease PerM
MSMEGGLGEAGAALDRRSPFWIGLLGFFGVAVAYVVCQAIVKADEVLLLVGLSLFMALGLNPIVELLGHRRIPRWAGTAIVTVVFLGLAGLFVAAALPPVAKEARTLSHNLPTYRRQIAAGQGTLGRLAAKLHLNGYVKAPGATSKSSPLPYLGGLLGAGKVLVTAVSGTILVFVLTVYFLVALPAVNRLWLRLMPASRRERVGVLTDEVIHRIGGYVLGNLLTSVIAGVGTTIWLSVFGVPYPFLLGVLVGVFDLIPVVGSTIGGAIVSLVALTQGVPVAVATAGFYIVYRFAEDHLVTPFVMRRTVQDSPGVTIIATLIGGVLLGIIGAVVAIPVAASIQLVLEQVTFPHLDRV